MSKIVFICFKDCVQNPYSHVNVEILSKRLTPDNISPPPPLIIEDNGIYICIFNPSISLPIKNTSVCMGNLIDPEDNWWVPMGKVPDGSYALFRSNKDTIELVTDIVASRTIWYIQTENVFIASTSQRAIVFFLQGFKLNKAAISWILSSGTLGPGLSWDNRIRCLSGNASLLLDRSSWKLTTKREITNFNPLNLSNEKHEKRLRKALEDTLEHLDIDYSKWVLPLSGGFDSRAILLMLKNQSELKCVSWGLKSSLYDKKNDAYVAKSLAKYLNVEHNYYETDISNEPIEKIFNRFLVAGEGRTDHISGYMDGFKIWQLLFEEGISGIIRGDEGFGWVPVATSFDVRRCVGANLFSDYSNLKSLDEFDLERQIWPKDLQRKDEESFATWRDRLYHDFRIPFILAALTDLKCTYVEVINPLLSRRIIEQVRRMPDTLRTDKRFYKKIVRSLSPKIGFGKYPAIADTKQILKTKKVVNMISKELNTTYARTLLSDKFIEYILGNIRVLDDAPTKNKKSIKEVIEHSMPGSLKNLLRNTFVKQQMDYNILAFRAYIVCKMNRILSADAMALDQN